MIPTKPNLHTENQSRYQVDSRREIITLLRSLMDGNQLIHLIINEGNEVIITAILDIDENSNKFILDSPASEEASIRLIGSPRIFIEASLNKISIKFTATNVINCNFKGRPALSCPIPPSLIRLQRREYYRVNTPLAHPVMCIISIPEENGGGTAKLPLADISCSGVALMDEKKLLNDEFGTLYNDCQIDLPDIGLVSIVLQVRNSQNLTLMNHKTSRRIGFEFVNLSKGIMSQIQKLITKIEREHNARKAGMN